MHIDPSWEDTALCIIDSLAFRRASLASLLTQMRFSGRIVDAASVEELSRKVEETDAGSHLVILNLGGLMIGSTPVQRSILELRRLFADLKFVVLSEHYGPDELVSAFRVGASGFLPVSLEPQVVLRALDLILAGGMFYPPTLLSKDPLPPVAGSDYVRLPAEAMPKLTPRQIHVVEGIMAGKSNKDIASDLAMSDATVKVHVRTIMKKLGVHNRTQVALLAMPSSISRMSERGLVR
jgi:DNA-binding NarL/FixJ family response regulator